MYGILQIANRYLEIFLLSIKTNQKLDDRVMLFARFLGIDDAN